MGVFGNTNSYKLPFEEKGNVEKFHQESLKKMHSLYFPIHWREAIVSIERIFLLQTPEFSKEALQSITISCNF